MSFEWVVDPGAMSATLRMVAPSGVSTRNCDAYATGEETWPTVGRAPANRYGGEKISAFSSKYGDHSPPAATTRPSGSSSAVEW
jgi:hypothetical protein